MGEADLSDITGLLSDPDVTDSGFYFVGEDGEKFMTDHVIFGGFVITTSFVPDDGSGGPCAGPGTTFIYVFDLLGGDGFFPSGTPGSASGRRLVAGAGIPSSPSVSTSGGSSKVFVQTSGGSVLSLEGPDPGGDGLDLIFCKLDI